MREKLLFYPLFFCMPFFAAAQLKVSDNNKFLSTMDGKPFFWLGDTDWELCHRLTRDEIAEFIDLRASQGFNVLQIVALAEFNGIREPNRYGDYPLNNEDPTQLLITPGNNPSDSYEYDYWDHVDCIISLAAQKGIYIGLLPTWGDKVTEAWGEGPVIFNPRNAEVYGSLLAQRYKNQWNILWILGGDRPVIYKSKTTGQEQDDVNVWRSMAKGIESVLGKKAFITYHPSGGEFRTTHYIAQESWMDMNAFQSGHGSRESQPWEWVKKDLLIEPHKPTLDMEPCYEDHPVNPWDGKWTKARGYFNAYDVRARIYRSVFSGACGVTYGHHQVWQFLDPQRYPVINVGDTIIGWRKAAGAEGAEQMKHLKNLILSRPYYSRLEDSKLVVSAIGTDYRDRIVAMRDEERAYAMVYLPQNVPIRIDLSQISGSKKKIYWYDVRSGTSVFVATVKENGVRLFNPPANGQDWVLVIDDASRNFKAPGVR